MFKVGDNVTVNRSYLGHPIVAYIPGVVSWVGERSVQVTIDLGSRFKGDVSRNFDQVKLVGAAEETPQELADKLRATLTQIYEVAQKLRALGFTLTVGGNPICVKPEPDEIIIEKTTVVTTKESL
jgi:hypothetical protein